MHVRECVMYVRLRACGAHRDDRRGTSVPPHPARHIGVEMPGSLACPLFFPGVDHTPPFTAVEPTRRDALETLPWYLRPVRA